MKFTIAARKTTVKDSFRERVEKKLSKLDRFFGEDAAATVVVTNERERETVEVTIQSQGMYFRAEKTTADRMDSLEAVVDSLFKQIVKNKSKLEQRLRDSAFSPDYHDELEAEDGMHVVKTKTFPVKPMHEEEAILQMNLLGHAFYMFRNAESNEINVVYRRKNGDYGLLIPEDD
ncbi:MAG: ribosome-associated translation inhibitor RaiA [Oscillospiraceae bacterium]|nr:ribosome-associated translation inhibitor RaiA [Oscillospiraceae bacterium]